MTRRFISGLSAVAPELWSSTPISGMRYPDGYMATGLSGYSYDTSDFIGYPQSLVTTRGPDSQYDVPEIERDSATASISVSIWFKISNLPSALGNILIINSAGFLRYSAAGGLYLYGQTTGQSSDLYTIQVNTWTHVELQLECSSTTAGTLYLYVNGKYLGSQAVTFNAQSGTTFKLSYFGITNPTKLDSLVVDTVASGTPRRIGMSRVALCLPIADAYVGTGWAGGLGGTTDLFEAINNTPPIGTDLETNLTQIESNGSDSSQSSTYRYEVNLTTLSTARVPSKSAVISSALFMVHGEDINTGTKTLAGALSVPNVAPISGALGVFPSQWFATVQSAPNEAAWTDEIDAVHSQTIYKTDGTTRVASISLFGRYIEYVGQSPPNIRAFPRPILQH